MAYLADHYKQVFNLNQKKKFHFLLKNINKKKGENVFYHFYDASLKSKESPTMAARFIKHFVPLNKGSINIFKLIEQNQ